MKKQLAAIFIQGMVPSQWNPGMVIHYSSSRERIRATLQEFTYVSLTEESTVGINVLHSHLLQKKV